MECLPLGFLLNTGREKRKCVGVGDENKERGRKEIDNKK